MDLRQAASRLLVTGLCVLASACATKPTFVIDAGAPQSGATADAAVRVIDERPAGDRESSMGSLLIASDPYGIDVLGDERFAPAPAEALAKRLEGAVVGMSPRPSSVTLILTRFNTQSSSQAAMGQGAISPADPAPMGAKLGEAILEKLREENVDARKPFVLSYGEAEVEWRWPDNRRTTGTITVLKANNYSEANPEEQKAAVQRTVSSALDTLAAAVRSAVAKK